MKMIQAVFGGVNMKKHIALLLILCTCLLAACQQVQPPATDSGGRGSTPVQTTGAPSPTTKPSTVPTQPTEPTEPIDEELAKFNALFGYEGGWYNLALFRQYTNPSKIDLMAVFHEGFEEESKEPTDAEWEQLKDQPVFNIDKDLMRLPVDRMNQVLMHMFGITLEDVDESGFEGLVYLESTNCYYHMTDDAWSVRGFNAFDMETLEDGTIRVYYTTSHGSGVFCVTVMPRGDGFIILSNIIWPAPTTQPLPDTPTEVLEEFNALFGNLDSWYNKALYYEYTTPTETLDWEIFSGAFREESNQISDSEIAELKAKYPDDAELIEYVHITRLPVERINQVLTQLFGITLADLDDSLVSGLPYLERTDCYYLLGGGSAGAMEFNAVAVEYMDDGSVRVYYTADWDSTVRCVTLMPYGDSYRILSNLPLE